MKNVVASVALITLVLSFSIYAQDSVYVLNHKEVVSSLSEIMKVDARHPRIKEVYSLVEDTLPKYGKVAEVTEATVLSLYKLSYRFCMVAFDRELRSPTSRRWFYLGLPIEKDLSSWNASEVSKMLTEFALQVYNRELSKDEVKNFNSALKSDLSGLKSKERILSVCAMFFSTPSFYLK